MGWIYTMNLCYIKIVIVINNFLRKRKKIISYLIILARKSFALFAVLLLTFSNFSFPAKAVSFSLDSQDIKTQGEGDLSDKDNFKLDELENKFKEKSDLVHIPFVKNQGQVKNNDVKYYANIFSGGFYVTEQGLRYALSKKESFEKDLIKNRIPENNTIRENKAKHRYSFDENFINKDNQLIKFSPIGENSSDIAISYFQGSDSHDWKSKVNSYNDINLGSIWENIEVRLKNRGNNIEKIFFIYPGGRPNEISIKFNGIEKIGVSENGKMNLTTPLGDIQMTAPVAYQEDEHGNRKNVEVEYEIQGSNKYGFKVGAYDQTMALTIDPLLASTSFGIEGYTEVNSIKADTSGNIYVAGYTGIATFPTTVGAYDTVFNSDYEGYVAKFNSDLTSLLAATYINDCWVGELQLSGSGNVVVAGGANSAFPTTAGAYDQTFNGNQEGFISVFDSDLSSLLYSTYIGGSGHDYLDGMRVDSGGNIYIVGSSYSPNYPVTDGAYDTTCGVYGKSEVFVSKFSSDLSSLSASTF